MLSSCKQERGSYILSIRDYGAFEIKRNTVDDWKRIMFSYTFSIRQREKIHTIAPHLTSRSIRIRQRNKEREYCYSTFNIGTGKRTLILRFSNQIYA